MSDSTKEDWRRRERATGGGLVLWALTVSAAVTLAPEQAADWIVATEPLIIAGVILVTVGLFGGFVETLILGAKHWAEAEDPEGLTDVPWDDSEGEQ